MKTHKYLVDIIFFSLGISCHRQSYQNYQGAPKRWQKSNFQSHLLVSKISRIFLFFSSLINIEIGGQLLL